MPKKGKGKKGKDKREPSGGNVRPEQQSQPGPSSEAGRGRGRGRTAFTSSAAVPQQQEPSKDQRGGTAEPSVSIVQESSKSPDGRGDRPFFSAVQQSAGVQQERTVPKGRGRGRGTPPKSSGPQSPGTSPQPDDSEVKETDYPELSASAARVTAPSHDNKKEVLSKAEQEELLSQMSGISLEHKSSVVEGFSCIPI